ncbi:carbohydrate ABC transporter permease, partial [Mesorhizobium sp. M7A.F.Ca.CA.004.02.1.1]
ISPFVKLFTKRSQLRSAPTPEEYAAAPWWERVVFDGGEKIVRDGKGQVQWSGYPSRFMNSLIIAITSTVLAVGMGTFTAYGFSRFKVKGEADLLFFILSTRMLPPVVVAIPMFLMYRAVGLNDTHVGLIILYTAFNLSFSVWLMKGFMDEIPKEYEEAALVDGYTRMEAFFKIVLPEAATGIAATAVFCFITAWNEYAFALIMTNRRAQTAPPFIPSQVGSGLPDWTVIAAGTFLFLLPVAIFTFLLRNHLLRGMSFGAIRK